MSTNSFLIDQMKDEAYRHAYVRSQITTALPFQLRALRKSRGWTQAQLAELTGMAQSRFPSLEKPSGRMPDLETLCRIAEAYDIALQVRFLPFSQLLEWDEGFSPDSFQVPTFEMEFGQNLAGYFEESVDVMAPEIAQRPTEENTLSSPSPPTLGFRIDSAPQRRPESWHSGAYPMPPAGQLQGLTSQDQVARL